MSDLRPTSAKPIAIRALGVLSILWGLLQWGWNGWAFDASWHLGSPIRRQSPPVVDAGLQSKICSEIYDTGMHLIQVLDRTLDLTLINGVVFVLLGLALLWSLRR
jgi:hypothetical protein